MKRIGFILLGFAVLMMFSGVAFSAQWYYSKSEAFNRANQMKNGRVLLVVGVESCTNTQFMKKTVIENPEVSAELSDFYVLWNVSLIDCPIWHPYFMGGDIGEPLPFIAIIDPTSDQVLSWKQGQIAPPLFMTWIREYIIE